MKKVDVAVIVYREEPYVKVSDVVKIIKTAAEAEETDTRNRWRTLADNLVRDTKTS